MKHAFSFLKGADETKQVDTADVVRIPWPHLQLEPKHFAHGGTHAQPCLAQRSQSNASKSKTTSLELCCLNSISPSLVHAFEGGGMVFRGEYMGSAIAAKQVFADKSQQELDDFYREARNWGQAWFIFWLGFRFF